MAVKVDWGKIKVEYQTTTISYRKLAEKYSIPFPTIRDRAKRENWTALRDVSRNKFVAVTSQKVIEKRAKKAADEIDATLEATDLISRLALEALQDPRQFYKFAIEETTQDIKKVEAKTTRGTSEKIVKMDHITTIAKDLGILDAKRLKELSGALSAATTLKRLINGVLTEVESQRIQIEREKLAIENKRYELDKQKAEKDNSGDDEEYAIIDPFAEEGENDQSRPEQPSENNQ